jgi:hypothetical protein
MPPQYPKLRLLRADALSVITTWCVMAITAILWLVQTFGVLALKGGLRLASYAFVVAASAHVILAFLHKCPHCGKHPTVQGFKAPHPNSLGQSGVQGWAGVVVSVIRRKRFVCIHCGTEFQA